MVKYSPALDSTFGALADPTRRAILATLMLGQASITELAKPPAFVMPSKVAEPPEKFKFAPPFQGT